MLRVVRVSGGHMFDTSAHVRCDLTCPDSPVEVNFRDGKGWRHTGFDASTCYHRLGGLVEVAKDVVAREVEILRRDFEASVAEVLERLEG